MGIEDVPSDEELDEYRHTARRWLAENMPLMTTDDEMQYYRGQDNARLKMLTRTLWEGGYSGICFPTEVDGAGLTRLHHQVFCEEAASYELPYHVGVPGLSIIAPPILEFGNDEQKQHIARMLRGDVVFVQMMSEPTGGSDMAGALTRADRDGDSWILNGSKVWSSGAHRSDWGLLLVRTNWDVPKHRGLSMLLLDLTLPGITVNTIKMVDGTDEFCQEYFDDVMVPHSCLLGEVDDGWTIASRLLYHERSAVGGSSPYAFNRPRTARSTGPRSSDLAQLVTRYGRENDPKALEMLGEAHADAVVSNQLIKHVSEGIATGAMPAISGSLLRLNAGTTYVRRSSIALELSGGDGITWDPDDKGTQPAEIFQSRQSSCIGGGTTEMQRNLISERILGMPREYAADKDRAFREVKH